MNKFLSVVIGLLSLTVQALAQQVPNHAIPIGRGAGVNGFRSVGPCGIGLPIIGAGLSSDAVCGTVPVGTSLIVQPSVRLTSAAVLPNSPTYSNGASGVGATLTAGANAALVVDAVTVASNDRILVKNQASAFQNGCFTVTTVGDGSTPWVLTRCTDFDTASEMIAGSYFFTIVGASNTSSSFVLAATVTTVGTTAANFGLFGTQSTPFNVADIRNYGAVCNGASSTGVTAAVTSAISAGYTNIFLPSGCYYFPTSNVTPNDITFIGGDWTTSVISSASPTVDILSIGARGKVQNIGLKSVFCTNSTTPLLTEKVCPTLLFANNSDSSSTAGNYPWTPFNINVGAAITLSGHTSTDNQGMTISNSSTGDGIFQATNGSGNNQLIWLYGDNDRGIFIESGKLSTENKKHTGLKIIDYSDGSQSPQRSLWITRYGNPEASFLFSDDNIAVAKTNPVMQFSLAGQTSGNLFQMQQSTSTFTGNFIDFTAEAGGTGSMTGNFLRFVRGTQKFKVDKDGNVTGGVYISGAATGLTTTKTVRASGGASDCTLIFTGGLLTGGSC